MPGLNLRLIEMLFLIALLVFTALFFAYFGFWRYKRLGIISALAGVVLGGSLTLAAVLPENEFFGPVFYQSDQADKVVALTFDDGPYPPYTDRLLDVLAEKRVPATFFVIGENAARHPELVKRIAREGHQVANHTYHHPDLLKLDAQEIAEEVDRTSKIIESLTGIAPSAVRPPHGFRDPVVLRVMRERRLDVVQWSVISRDWTNPGSAAIVERTLRKVGNGAVILPHDGDGIAAEAARIQSVEAAGIIIERLQEQGYRFVTVAELQKEKTEAKK